MNSKVIIVIVDDDPDDREIVRDAFVAGGIAQEFVCLESGDQLLEFLELNKGSNPSLILLDLNMPGKDGRETLKEIKSNQAFTSIPTVVFTTSSSQRDRQICYDLGANLFITKPDTFNKLVDLTACIARLWLLQ
jgi:CheY-like chemotaxis protein